ncbi:MAG: DUF438 domain-containing protein [Candidatus Thermoplasmatota archaeon]|nr:DUF438 domain-containing protein [Candidatus Thermoplasmatota archaeon]MBS3789790.1 DUF438 domain-containing protein [Candidatus Thermoplasmatota archaeon]
MSVEELYESLRGLAEGEVSEKEALEKIKRATPVEISKAEQRLVQEEDFGKEEFKNFCDIHLKAVEDEVEEMKNELEEGHPIRILILEHEEILEALDKLQEIGKALKNRNLTDSEKKELEHLAEHLVEAEKHHDREEEVIFPRLVKEGITGPVDIMEMDHEEMWPKKKELKSLSEDTEENKKNIIELIDYLVLNLRDHIFKENNILYPSALEELEDWDKMRTEGEEIGYCCFTLEDETDHQRERM